MNVFEDNPALPKQREKLMLTNLVTHYDDIKNINLEQMVEQIEVGNFDFLENEANKGIFQKIVYYLNLTNHKEWFLLTLFSITTTIILIIVDNIIVIGFNWRYNMLSNNSTIFNVFIYFLTSQVLALIATSVGYFVSPDSDGSGIPEIKVVLSGNPMYQFYNFNALFGKIIGLIAGTCGGLTIGRAGPYVHISCIISKQVLKSAYFEDIKSSSTGKNMMLIVGCAAGITLAFGTPLAAVVFSIEQTSTVYLVSNLWKSFYVAINCIFIKNIIYNATRLRFNIIEEEHLEQLIEFKHEAWFFIVLGILCGIVGAFFNIFMGKIAFTRRTSKNPYYNNRWKYVSIISLICCFVAIIFPPLRSGQTKIFSVLWRPNKVAEKLLMGSNQDVGTRITNITSNYKPIVNRTEEDLYFNITESNGNVIGQVNKTIIDIILNNDIKEKTNSTITHAIENNDTQSNFYNPLLSLLHPNEGFILLLCFLGKFFLTIICCTANLPVGILGPIFLLGSIFGRLYGHVLYLIFGVRDEYLYSMAGAACLLSSSIHSIAPPIIIFELTGQSNYLIHLLFSALLANLIGQSLSVSGFDLILFIRKLPYLPSVKSSKLYELTAKNIKEKISFYLRVPSEDQKPSITNVMNNLGNNNNILNTRISSFANQSQINAQSLNDPDFMNNMYVNPLTNMQAPHHQYNFNNLINNPTIGESDDNFDRNSLHFQEHDNQIRIYNEFNIISALILLYKLPKKYFLNIPVVDSNNYIKYTFTAKKLFAYIQQEYNKNKHKFDVRIHSSMNELLVFFKNKFIPNRMYFILKMFLKFKKFFENMNENHKHRLDKYFLESSMYEILRRLKEFSAINKESFLNTPIDYTSEILDLDKSYLTIEQSFSALKIQFLFTFLSMSHLFVTDKGRLVGIITKEEFIKKSMTIK